jgi:hypothetical protein
MPVNHSHLRCSQAVGRAESLWDLLQVASERRVVWEAGHCEDARLALARSWDIWITCPGSRLGHQLVQPGTWSRCTPTVLGRDTGDENNHLVYRGACLGCGWVAEQVHPIWEGGENEAAEDANDHGYPGWRDLPIVERPPHNDGGAAYGNAVSVWRNRWERILPPGWLDRGGPIRTLRKGLGTRHVPGGAPGGGYDMNAGDGAAEVPGGQLGLF